jgi:enterochelin esterase family protein
LQHGGSEDESGWTRQGKANFILDNLIAAGKAKPMIIVMANGYARRDAATPMPGGPPSTPEARKAMQDMVSAFADDVTKALIPVHRLGLPHDTRSRASRNGGSFDGRHANV